MSLAKQTIKLRGISPLALLKRNKSGWPGNAYIPGPWGGCSHVINRSAMNRVPFPLKMVWGTVFVCSFFTYPLYVTYMMYEWDRLDEGM